MKLSKGHRCVIGICFGTALMVLCCGKSFGRTPPESRCKVSLETMKTYVGRKDVSFNINAENGLAFHRLAYVKEAKQDVWFHRAYGTLRIPLVWAKNIELAFADSDGILLKNGDVIKGTVTKVSNDGKVNIETKANDNLVLSKDKILCMKGDQRNAPLPGPKAVQAHVIHQCERLKATGRLIIRGALEDYLCLRDFPRLKHLCLDGYELTKLEKVLGHLDLHSLSLYNGDGGKLKELQKLKSLSDLHIENTKVTSLDVIVKTVGLSRLGFVNCGPVDMAKLGNAAELKQLHLSDSDVANFSEILKLKKLERLHLSKCKGVELISLIKLPKLRELGLYDDQSTSELGVLSKLTGLEELSLWGYTESIHLQGLSAMTKLKKLYLCDIKKPLNLSPLEKLDSLQELNLRGSKIKDFAPVYELDGLEFLWVDNDLVMDLGSYIVDNKKMKKLKRINFFWPAPRE